MYQINQCTEGRYSACTYRRRNIEYYPLVTFDRTEVREYLEEASFTCAPTASLVWTEKWILHVITMLTEAQNMNALESF